MYTLDDGTVVSEDAAGNVTVLSSSSGQVYQPDRSLLADFASTIFGSLGRAIDNRLNPAPASSTGAAASAAAPAASPVVMMALIVGAGFLVYKLLK